MDGSPISDKASEVMGNRSIFRGSGGWLTRMGCVTLSCAMFCGGVARAEPFAHSDAPLQLTMVRALGIALERNLDLQIAENAIAQRAAVLHRERAGRHPNLNLSVGPQ